MKKLSIVASVLLSSACAPRAARIAAPERHNRAIDAVHLADPKADCVDVYAGEGEHHTHAAACRIDDGKGTLAYCLVTDSSAFICAPLVGHEAPQPAQPKSEAKAPADPPPSPEAAKTTKSPKGK